MGAIAELFFPRASRYRRSLIRNIIEVTPFCGVGFGAVLGGPTVKSHASLALHVIMSRGQLRELTVLFVVGSTLTLAVFFLALLLLPFETFNPFSFPRFPGFF